MRRPQHAPPELEKYLNTTHAGLVQWASRLGPSVALVAQEVFADRRDFKQLGRRLTKSGLAPDKTLETFDFSFNPRIHAPTLRELATCRFVERAENVFLVGPSGVGKKSMEDVGWSVTETALRLRCERGTLSRLLNGKAGVSANMALALEDIGWGTAEHWMRMQASYDLAQARRERTAVTAVADFR